MIMLIAWIFANPIIPDEETFKTSIKEMTSLSDEKRKRLEKILGTLYVHETDLGSSSQSRKTLLEKVEEDLKTFSAKPKVESAADSFIDDKKFEEIKKEYEVLVEQIDALQKGQKTCADKLQELPTPNDTLSENWKGQRDVILKIENDQEIFNIAAREKRWKKIKEEWEPIEKAQAEEENAGLQPKKTPPEIQTEVATKLKKADVYFYEQMQNHIEEALKTLNPRIDENKEKIRNLEEKLKGLSEQTDEDKTQKEEPQTELKPLKEEIAEDKKKIEALNKGLQFCQEQINNRIYAQILPENFFEDKADLKTSFEHLLEIKSDQIFDIGKRDRQWGGVKEQLKDALQKQAEEENRKRVASKTSSNITSEMTNKIKKADAYFYDVMQANIAAKLDLLKKQLNTVEMTELDEVLINKDEKIRDLTKVFNVEYNDVKKWVMLKLKLKLYELGEKKAPTSSQTALSKEIQTNKTRIDVEMKKLPDELRAQGSMTSGSSSSSGKPWKDQLQEAEQKQVFNMITPLIRIAFSTEDLSSLKDNLPSQDDMIAFNNKLSNAKYNAETNAVEIPVSGEKDKKELITDIDQEAIKVFMIVEIIRRFNHKKSELKRTEYKTAFGKILEDLKSKYKNLFSQYIEQDSKMRSFMESLKEEMDSTWKDVERDKPSDLGVGKEWNDTVVPVVLQTIKPLFKTSELPEFFKEMPRSGFDVMYDEIKGKGTSKTLFTSEIKKEKGKEEEQKGIAEDIFEKLQKKAEETTKESGKGSENDPFKSLIDLFK